MTEALVSLRDVSLARGERVLVEGLSLEIEPGDIVWLQGPNGSGKSTLLRSIAGFVRPLAGEITRSAEPEDLFAYVGHRDGFADEAGIDVEAAFWGVGDRRRRKGLSRSRRIASLSAGQRKRMDLSRLTRSDRKVWLLDEPYASLDAQGADRMTDLIRDFVASRRGAVVVSSHRGLPEFGREIVRVSLGAAG